MPQDKVKGGSQSNVNIVPFWQGWFRRDEHQEKPTPTRKLPKEPRNTQPKQKRGK